MKRLLVISMVMLLSFLAFGEVKIVSVKDEFGDNTSEKRVVYFDDRGAFALDYVAGECTSIRIETSNTPYEVENFVKFKIDDNRPLALFYETERKNRKVLICYPNGENKYIFKRVLEKIDSGKILKYVYSNMNGQNVVRSIPLKDIQKNIKKIQGTPQETVSKITKRTRGKGKDKQVWIEDVGWVYESLIEKP